MSTQVDLFTNVEPTSVSPDIAKPFVSRSTFYQGDCLVEMNKIADKSVDMILCDLPYGTTACKWDILIPFEPLWKQYNRIAKDNAAIVLFGDEPFSSYLRMSNIKDYRYDWVWDKKMVTGVGTVKIKPMKGHENILVFYKAKPTYNPQLREVKKPFGKIVDMRSETTGDFEYSGERGIGYPKTILEFPKPNNLSKKDLGGLHPTQKPTSLLKYLVKTYTNEFETVLDNTMGSGSTGVACKELNRHFIGIEKDEKYFEIAVSRVSAYCG